MNQHLFMGHGKSGKGIEVKLGTHVYTLSGALLRSLLGLVRARLCSDGWVAPAGLRCRNARHARVVVTRLRKAMDSKDAIETSAGEYRLTIPRDRLHIDVAALEEVLGPAETVQLKNLCDNAARPGAPPSSLCEDESNSRPAATAPAVKSPPPLDSDIDRFRLGESWPKEEYNEAIRDLAKHLIDTSHNFDCLVAVEDLELQGRDILARDLFACLKQLGLDASIPLVRAQVQGGLTSLSGRPRHCLRIDLPTHAKRIVIADDVSFTGNTLNAVRDAIRQRLGNVAVSAAVLAAGWRLLEDLPELGMPLHYQRQIAGSSLRLPYQRAHPTAPFFSWTSLECQAAIRKLAKALIDTEVPDCLVAVYDPESPGGVNVLEALSNCLSQLHPAARFETGRIRIQGGRARSETEAVTPGGGSRKSWDVRIPGSPRRILVIDDVSFTGNTLRIARDAIKEILPDARLTFAVLAAGRELIRTQSELGPTLEFYYREVLGDHVNFPWSRADPTHALCDYLSEPERLHRPWGYMDIFVKQHVCSVRILTFDHGQRMSLQRHQRRDEVLVAIDDGLTVQIGETAEQVKRFTTVARQGDQMFIPRNMWHRFGAPLDRRVRSLEIAFGEYDQNDIERLDDDYGRPKHGDMANPRLGVSRA